MSYTTNNYAVSYLRGVDEDAEFLSRPSQYPDKSISVTVGLNIMVEALSVQSLIFAEELVSYGFPYFKNIFATPYIDMWKTLAAETYVYSFYKCLFIGLNGQMSRDKLPESLAFVGHAIFCNLLIKQKFKFEEEFYRIYVTIDLEDDTCTNLLQVLEDTFPFLNETKVLSSFGDSTVYSSKFEGILDRLKLEVEKSGNNAILSIKPINDTAVLDLCNSAENPIINGLYNQSLESFLYIPSSKRISSDVSYFLSRANFLSLKEIKGVQSNEKYYYNAVDLVNSFHLMSHDVRSITYLMPKISYSEDVIRKLYTKVFRVKDDQNFEFPRSQNPNPNFESQNMKRGNIDPKS